MDVTPMNTTLPSKRSANCGWFGEILAARRWGSALACSERARGRPVAAAPARRESLRRRSARSSGDSMIWRASEPAGMPPEPATSAAPPRCVLRAGSARVTPSRGEFVRAVVPDARRRACRNTWQGIFPAAIVRDAPPGRDSCTPCMALLQALVFGRIFHGSASTTSSATAFGLRALDQFERLGPHAAIAAHAAHGVERGVVDGEDDASAAGRPRAD